MEYRKRGGITSGRGLVWRASMIFRSRVFIGVLLAALVGPVGVAPALAPRDPVRSISIPRTLTRTTKMAVPAHTATVRLSLRPTHIAFSWRGAERTGVRFRTIGAGGEVSRWRRAPV